MPPMPFSRVAREDGALVEFLLTNCPEVLAAEEAGRILLEVGRGARLAIAGGSCTTVLGPLRERLGPRLWGSLRVTWVDERRVPVVSADSNRGAAYRAGLIGPSAPVGLEVPLWLDSEEPEAALRRLGRVLREEFDGELDAVLLGMGEDGHVASLFPGHPALSAAGLVVLVEDSPKPPPQRISLTFPLLCTARRAVLVATGPAKRRALGRLRAGDDAIPARRIPRLTVVTDQETPLQQSPASAAGTKHAISQQRSALR